jgi:predicted small lipoprotein YifL
MRNRFWTILAAAALTATLSACAPLVGGVAAVAADEAIEQEEGGDGLF